MTPAQQTYEVIADGFVAGRRRRAGERLELTQAQAEFLVLDGLVKRVEEEPAPEAPRKGKSA